MIRKLISIPTDLEKLIALTAMQEQKPQAEVIREKLRAGFAVTKPIKSTNHALLNIAKHAIPDLDPHLSTNIDKFLYEE